MRRTENRPLPSGRLQPLEVLAFGLLLGGGGVAYLALTLTTGPPRLTAGVTFVCYVGVYTPLKARTTLNTLVGAVPGALPPLIGWTAVRGGLTLGRAAAVPDRVSVAGAALPGHRLDLPRPVRPRRVADAAGLRSHRTAAPADA